MSLVKISITPQKKVSRNKLVELVDDYCIALRRNGQIIGQEWSYAWNSGVLNYFVEAPRPDSLSAQYYSEWVQKAFETITKAVDAPIKWEVLEELKPQRFARLETAPFLCLYYSPLMFEPPIRRGDDGRAIPAYLIPIDQWWRQQLHDWNAMSGHFNSIWYNSGPLEMPAYRQLSDPHSEHCRDGRQLCQKIEEATNIPTYLYLMRYYGRQEGEEKRLCPICGGAWRVASDQIWKNKYWRFDFKCDACRLVSDLASSVEENEKYAEIGEYTPSSRKKRA